VEERQLGGRYQIVSHLGRGGFAQTYLAEDIQIPHRPRCVVKQLQLHDRESDFLSTARRLFQQEAETLGKLGAHPQIPQLFAYFEEEGEFFLVQEYIEGRSIAAEIREREWQEEEIVKFIAELLHLLHFVHNNNVIHRDIKPDNLIRRKKDGKLVLIDFGAVKEIIRQTKSGFTSTKTTIGIGTVGYMPPEQIVGKPRICSDIYGVGITAIQALIGGNLQELNYDEDGEVIWSPHTPISQELIGFLDKTVKYYIRDRYQTATEALADLQKLFPAMDLDFSIPVASELDRPTAFNSPTTLNPTSTVSINVIKNKANNLLIPLTSIHTLRRRKPILFGVGLAALLASGISSLSFKSWSYRQPISIQPTPNFSVESVPASMSESLSLEKQKSLTEKIDYPSRNNQNKEVTTVTSSTSNNRSTESYGSKSTDSQNQRIPTSSIEKKPTNTTVTNSNQNKDRAINKNSQTEKKSSTSENSNRSQKQSQTNNKNEQTQKRTTTRSERVQKRTTTRNDRVQRRTTTRNDRVQKRKQSVTRNDRSERRNRSTSNKKKSENRRGKQKT
jgi:serine/threonine protein kinase